MKNKSHRSERFILSWILAITLVLSNGLPVMAGTPRTGRVEITSASSTSNQDEINTLIGDGNTTYTVETSTTTTDAQGGAIWIGSTANLQGSILPSFNTSYATSSGANAEGGAIWNNGTISGSSTTAAIIGNFTGNYAISEAAATATQSYHAYGGAIYNAGTIGSDTVVGIKGAKFIGNYVKTTKGGYDLSHENVARGGAIFNALSARIYGIVNSIFEGNHADAPCALSIQNGGAIYNQGTIDSIRDSSFTGNYISNDSGYAMGGAIAIQTLSSRIDAITSSSFTGNYISSDSAGSGKGGAIAVDYETSLGSIANVTFEDNYISAPLGTEGGAISNAGEIGNIEGVTFKGNYAKTTGESGSAQGGAVTNTNALTSITSSHFAGNFLIAILSAEGGAIYNAGEIGKIEGVTFKGNYAKATGESGSAQGGAIRQGYKITNGISDSSFTDNYVEATGANGTALGGAIYVSEWANDLLLIKAQNKDVTFSGNYVKAPDMTKAQGSAIYVAGTSKILTLNAAEGRKITFEDDQTIEGVTGYSVNITGGGTVEFSQLNDNKIYTKNAGIYSGTVTVNDAAKLVLSGAAQISANLTVNSSSDFLFDFAKDSRVTDHEFDTINFGATAGNGTLTLDADLATETMDSITTKTTSTVSGNTELHVTALSLFNDAKEDKTEIPFTTDSKLKEITKYDRDGEELASHANKYIVNYDKTTGKFILKKSGVSNTTIATGDTVNVMNFVWLETVNNLQKRLGDLRGGEESDMAWARFQRNNDDHKTSREFNVSGNMYQVGYDFALKNQVASRGYFGVSLEAFDGTQSYAIGGGDVKSMSLGAYYTKIYDSGHYFDFILRYGRLENDSTSYDATAGLSGILTKLDYAMNSVTLSGEYGYRWNMGNAGLYLEPQAEVIYGYLSGAQATSSTNYLADIDSTNHFVTRLGLAFGQRVKNFNYYLRGSYYHDFAGTIHVKYGGTPYQQDSAQNWWEVSLGGGWNISKLSYFYAELTKHFKDVSNSLNFNLGFRFTL